MKQQARQAVWAGLVWSAVAIAGCAESRLSSGGESATLRECASSDCMLNTDAGIDPGEAAPEPDDVTPESPSIVEPSAPPPSFASYQLALESCGTVRESAYRGESHAELQALLLGDWFMCERGAWWGADEVGIRIDPNGRWTLLLLEGESIALARDVSAKGDYIWGDNGTGSGGTPAILMDLAANPGDISWEVYTPTFSDAPLRMYEWPVGRGDHEIELIAAH